MARSFLLADFVVNKSSATGRLYHQDTSVTKTTTKLDTTLIHWGIYLEEQINSCNSLHYISQRPKERGIKKSIYGLFKEMTQKLSICFN